MVKAKKHSYTPNDHMKTQMEIDTCKNLPFLKISRTKAWKIAPFSWFRTSRWTNAPSFAKMRTNMVYATW